MQFPSLPDEALEQPESPISLHCEDVDFSLKNEAAICDWLLGVARQEDKTFYEVSYIFCSDNYLLQVNIDYLNHDYYTDIITFQLTDGMVHGDIFISLDRVSDNANQHQVSFEQELHRVMVHGVLHLSGYGDKTDEEETTMRAKEDFYLAQLS